MTKRDRESDRRPIKTWSPCGATETAANVAVTVWSDVSVREQGLAVPEQSPLQPVKLEPESAAAVSVTLVPCANAALQFGSQLMPSGALVTVPEPVPLLETRRLKFVAGGGPEASNRAVTDLLEVIDIAHWP